MWTLPGCSCSVWTMKATLPGACWAHTFSSVPQAGLVHCGSLRSPEDPSPAICPPACEAVSEEKVE